MRINFVLSHFAVWFVPDSFHEPPGADPLAVGGVERGREKLPLIRLEFDSINDDEQLTLLLQAKAHLGFP